MPALRIFVVGERAVADGLDVRLAAMLVRRPVRSRLASSLLVLALPLGCNNKGEFTYEAGADNADAGSSPTERPPLFNPDPSSPAPTQLVPALDGAALGMQPGFLDGGFLFASARSGVMQTFAQSVPLSPRSARELAEVGELLGADPRVDDVIAYLGIDPNGRTSMSIRPVLDHAGAVKEAIDAGGPILAELHRPEASAPDQPEPPPLSAAAELLLDRAESLGLHVRVHVPILDPARSADKLAALQRAAEANDNWATTCATLPSSPVCAGGSDGMLVIRQLPGALELDALIFFKSAHDEADTELRRAVIQQALAMPVARTIPTLEALRGDANLVLASAPAFNAMRAESLTSAVRNFRWEGDDELADYRSEDAALLALHEPERIFEGIKIEATVDPQRILASFAWLPTTLGKQKAAEVFELLQVDADVPALASLCQDSLLCARSRGLPSPARFESLATGPFASPEAFEATMDQGDDDHTMLLLMLESWPNLVGTAAKFPGQSLEPPESVIADNIKQAAQRVLAFGMAIRKLEISGNQAAKVEWVGFARMPSMDLATLRGLMRMAELGLAPVTLQGVPGSIEAAELPGSELKGRFYSISDPPVATGEWGWAAFADGDASIQWMAGLPRDDGAAPIAYFEIRDLWRLISGVDEVASEFGFARAWLSGRGLRAQWDNTKAGPEVRVVFEKPKP